MRLSFTSVKEIYRPRESRETREQLRCGIKLQFFVLLIEIENPMDEIICEGEEKVATKLTFRAKA